MRGGTRGAVAMAHASEAGRQATPFPEAMNSFVVATASWPAAPQSGVRPVTARRVAFRLVVRRGVGADP